MQLLGAASAARARSVRFLTDDRTNYEQYLVSPGPVGTVGICVGRTGRPTPDETVGEHRRRFSTQSRGKAAPSLSRMERSEGGLPIFEPAGSERRTNSKPALGTHPGPLPGTWRISADR